MDGHTTEFNQLLKFELSKISNNKNEEDRYCLISKEPLEDIHIKLSCNHIFNYESIFNEIIKQKIKKNYKETQKLRKNEIKCPYCRNVQTSLLPYNPSFHKVKYVNWPPDKSMKSPYLKEKCSYIFKSGKRKGLSCGKACNKDYCTTHAAYIKRREAKKQEKQEKQAKQEKQEKQAKQESKNEIISITQPVQSTHKYEIPTLYYACSTGHYTRFNIKCNHIISRGKNKGNLCGKEFIISDIPGGIKLHRKKWLCPKCNKLKKYKNKEVEYYDAKEIPVKNNSIHHKFCIFENNPLLLYEFLEHNYKFYTKNKEWTYIQDPINKDIKFIKNINLKVI